jgi:hypothetical protein
MNYNLNEIVRYMGGNAKSIDSKYKDHIESCWEKFTSKVIAKHEYLTANISVKNNTVILKDLDIIIESQHLSRHLKNCDKIVILLSSLGVMASNIIRKSSIISSTEELIYNAIANYFLEEYNDIIQTQLNEIHGCTTNRFGTGYGDLDLSYNEIFLRLLPNKIGVSINSSYIFNPKKTTLSIIGVGKKYIDHQSGCIKCNLKDSCIFRKEN